jgi:hypothetical protein
MSGTSKTGEALNFPRASLGCEFWPIPPFFTRDGSPVPQPSSTVSVSLWRAAWVICSSSRRLTVLLKGLCVQASSGLAYSCRGAAGGSRAQGVDHEIGFQIVLCRVTAILRSGHSITGCQGTAGVFR